MKYTVWALDVWGHGEDEHEQFGCDGNCDGYWVNDRRRVGTIDLVEPHTDRDVLIALWASGHLPSETDVEAPHQQIQVNEMGEDEILIDEDDFPLFQLEAVREEG